MHMLNCLYSSNWAGVCKYSPSAKGFSRARKIQGFTFLSLRIKSEISTTRSRTIGKYRKGSTRIGPGQYSVRKVAHVNLGEPLTVMPQLPQTPMRHDQRCDRVGSRWSLM